MYFFYLTKDSIIITEERLKHEQIQSTKDYDNIDKIVDQLKRTYKDCSIDRRVKVKRQFGWKYWSDETKEKSRKAISRSLTGLLKSEEHKRAISLARKGKGNFTGKKHTDYTKALLSHARRGKDPIKGKRWCHNPLTGEERRLYELIEGFTWGRSPEIKDYFGRWR